MVVFQKIKLFIFFSQLFLYLLINVRCQECSKHMTFNDNHINRRLFGFILETWTDIKLHDCARWCLSDRRCKSFNHRENLNMCDLNNETADNVDPMYMLDYGTYMWNYFDISIWEGVFDPGCDDSLCPSSDICIKGSGAPLCYKNPPRCPDDYFQFEQKCYTFGNVTVNWFEAMDYCNTINSTLGNLRTWEENVYIVELMRGLLTTKALVFAIWSGVKYAQTPGKWVHQPDIDEINMDYAATWNPSDNADGKCCLIRYETSIIGAWTVADCVATTSLFCEKDLPK